LRRFDVLAQQAAAEFDVSHAILEGEIIVTDETVRP
jgi:ATP-dependent DNA ligase